LRLSRRRPGIRVGREIRLPVPGTMVRLAARPPWLAGARRRPIELRDISRKPRPGRQFRGWKASRPGDEPGTDARAPRAPLARATDPDAVSGTGVRVVGAVPLLRGSCAGAGPSRARGARRVPAAISERRDASGAGE